MATGTISSTSGATSSVTGTISSLGVGSGLDLNGMLTSLRAADQQVITAKQNSITTYQSQLSEFTVINNKLLTMKSNALDLSLSTTFLARTATSSSPTVLTATVADGTAPQNTAVTVGRIATTSTWMSAGMADPSSSVNTTASSQNFIYHVGATDITVAVPAGTTLSGLVNLINTGTGNPGVTASLINDGSGVIPPATVATPYKLVLQANATGSNQEITMTAQLPALAMSVQGQTGANLNAQVTVGGVSYQRQTNTIGDVISGVTLNLQTAGSSTVSVASNSTAVQQKIVDFVTSYNDVVQEISKNTGYNTTTSSFGILASTTLRDLPSGLENLMTSQVKADSKGLVTTMFDLGMAFNRDGTISIDTTKLSAAIAASPDSVSAFFLGNSTTGVTGLGDQVNTYIRNLTSDSGQIKAEQTAAQARIDDTQQQIDDTTALLNKKYDTLTTQFIALDQYMSQMKSMSSYLTQQFNSLTSTTGTSSSSG